MAKNKKKNMKELAITIVRSESLFGNQEHYYFNGELMFVGTGDFVYSTGAIEAIQALINSKAMPVNTVMVSIESETYNGEMWLGKKRTKKLHKLLDTVICNNDSDFAIETMEM